MKTPGRTSSGPTLMAQAYWALWAQAQALLCLVYGLEPTHSRWFIALSSALLPVAFLGYVARLAVQDWFVSARGAERAFIPLIALGCFQMPIWLRGHHVLPEGFVFALFPLLFFSFGHGPLMWLWGVMTLGSWFALADWPGEPGGFIGPAAVMGALSLWSLTAIHYASVGAPFGLRGWWPFSRVIMTVIFFCVPSGLAAWLAASLRLDRSIPASPPPPSAAPEIPLDRVYQRLQRLSRAELMELFIRAGLSILVLLTAIVTLWLVRKWLGRRAKPARAPILFGADIAESEITGIGQAAEPATLDGPRGEALALWRRWERALAQSGRAREANETASEFTTRIASELGAGSDSRRIARLLESAHYALEEPSPSDLSDMNDLVDRAMALETPKERK